MRSFFLKIKGWVCFAILIFLGSSLYGFVFSAQNPEFLGNFLKEASSLVEFLMSLERWQLTLFIFLNNSVKVFAAMITGAVFGIFPVIFLIINGFLVGAVAQQSLSAYGQPVFWAGIAPHGIFEFAALFLGSGAGIYLGAVFFKKALKKEEVSLKSEILHSLKFFAFLIIPLLLAASIIEGYVTPGVLDRFL